MGEIISIFVGIAALLIIGFQDLRTRHVTWEWLYIVIILCGIIAGGNLLVKAICAIAGSALLLLCAYIVALLKNKGAGKETAIEAALNYIGGADLKTIAVTAFLLGPEIMVWVMLMSILFSVPFTVKPQMGMSESAKSAEDVSERAIPFCCATALSTVTVVSSLFTAAISNGAF